MTRGDIQDTAGSVQLCAGQIAGVEAAVHAVQESFQQDATEAVLLVDASNAFNSLNRDAALHKIYLPLHFHHANQHLQSPNRVVH